MKCPYCNVGVFLKIRESIVYPTREYSVAGTGNEFVLGECPECAGSVVLLRVGTLRWIDEKGELVKILQEELVYPKSTNRLTSAEVPSPLREIFNESNAVLTVSPKSSAALSRRLLQEILQTKFGIRKRDLKTEIEEFIDLRDIPSDLKDAVDAIRNVGNFAAHPSKYQSTGEIVDVEVGEAEWLLEVLELLFDYAYVQPKRAQDKKDSLNRKLAELGKPPMIG